MVPLSEFFGDYCRQETSRVFAVNPDVAKTLTVVALYQNSLGPVNFAFNNHI
jgi:hypothetical protein